MQSNVEDQRLRIFTTCLLVFFELKDVNMLVIAKRKSTWLIVIIEQSNIGIGTCQISQPESSNKGSH